VFSKVCARNTCCFCTSEKKRKLREILDPGSLGSAASSPRPPRLPTAQQAPEGLPLHVFLCDAMVDQGLVPNRVPGVPQGLCAKLVRL
jgi:hypothetical protein